MNTKLYVGNLSYNTTENNLQDTFAAHGPVTNVDMIMDRDTGRPRGFAFVTMESGEAAEAAISASNGANLDGRDLTVNEAHSRNERLGGGGRGRGSRQYANRYENHCPVSAVAKTCKQLCDAELEVFQKVLCAPG